MKNYNASIPIHLEYVSEFDSYDDSTFAECEFSANITIKTMQCSIAFDEKKDKYISIQDIEANDEIEAFTIVNKLLLIIANCISVFIQRKNVNQHYGHIRVRWFLRDLNITPRDQWPSASLSTKMITTINLDGLEEAVLRVWDSPDLQFITQAYYGALQSLDHRAKYYHAFTIMEHLENKYKDDVGNKKYSDADCKKAANLVFDYFTEQCYSLADANHAKGCVTDSLKKVTNETRAEKLQTILEKYFDITQVNYLGEVTIDKKITKDFIDTRNGLFHGSVSPGNLKRNCDLLILVCEKIIGKLLS